MRLIPLRHALSIEYHLLLLFIDAVVVVVVVVGCCCWLLLMMLLFVVVVVVITFTHRPKSSPWSCCFRCVPRTIRLIPPAVGPGMVHRAVPFFCHSQYLGEVEISYTIIKCPPET